MGPEAFLWACNVMALLLFATPGILFYFSGPVTLSPYTYALTALNCGFAMAYGIWTGVRLVSAINGIGMVAEAIYVGLFLLNCEAADPRRWWLIVILICELVLFPFGIVLLFVSVDLYRLLRSVTGIVVAAAPLINVPSVFRTGNVASLPHHMLAVVSLVNAGMWTANFKWVQPDNYLGAPNWAIAGSTLRAFCWLRQRQQLPIVGTVRERLLPSSNDALPPPPPPLTLFQLTLRAFSWWRQRQQIGGTVRAYDAPPPPPPAAPVVDDKPELEGPLAGQSPQLGHAHTDEGNGNVAGVVADGQEHA